MKIVKEIIRIFWYVVMALSVAAMFHLIAKWIR